MAKKKQGRPSLYTPEIGDRICGLIATTNRGLGFILKQHDDLPGIVTVLSWLGHEDKADFLNSYLRAREAQADLIFDECLEIADDTSGDAQRGDNGKETQHATEQVARSKLRVDTRLRMAGKLAPKKYGDQLHIDQTVRTADVSDTPDPGQRQAEKQAWGEAAQTLQ